MYLDTKIKNQCTGCEACAQICPMNAISMQEDNEGFLYPETNEALCVHCDLCRKVCPDSNAVKKYTDDKYVFGGFILDAFKRFESTSGGAFSAIVDAYCDDNYVIFGAEAKGLKVYHSYVTDKSDIGKFRKSKYSQSKMGDSYKQVKAFLLEGKKVLFSGTPCQIAGLKNYLGDMNQETLLTVEVVCEGVPSPLYINKLNKHIEKKYGSGIDTIDYRYTGKSLFSRGKWDFQGMLLKIRGGGVPRKMGLRRNEDNSHE